MNAHADETLEDAHLVVAVARDERDLARVLLGLAPEAADERHELDADRVLDPAEVLDVRVVELPRAVADPQKVRADVVELVAHAPRHGLLIRELEPLVRDEQVHRAQVGRVGADAQRVHEVQAVCDLLGHLAVLLAPRRRLHEVQVPRAGVMDVGEARAHEYAAVVECRRAVEVPLEQSLRVRHALVLLVPVDVLAAEAGHTLCPSNPTRQSVSFFVNPATRRTHLRPASPCRSSAAWRTGRPCARRAPWACAHPRRARGSSGS